MSSILNDNNLNNLTEEHMERHLPSYILVFIGLLYKPCWSWIWIFVHRKTQYQFPVPWNDKNPPFFSKAGKEKADVAVRLLEEMMETSRAKQRKHYLKNIVNKENKKEENKKSIKNWYH